MSWVNEQLDRGLQTNFCSTGGFEVHMHCDTPGVYYDSHGKELPAEIARAAGFPVDQHLKAKKFAKQRDTAAKQIATAMKMSDQRDEIETSNGFKLIQVGESAYIVENADGEKITPLPVSEVVGRSLLELMGKEEGGDEEDGKEQG